jgi:hypothetical protein
MKQHPLLRQRKQAKDPDFSPTQKRKKSPYTSWHHTTKWQDSPHKQNHKVAIRPCHSNSITPYVPVAGFMVSQTTQISAISNDDFIHYTLQVANHKINGSKEEEKKGI